MQLCQALGRARAHDDTMEKILHDWNLKGAVELFNSPLRWGCAVPKYIPTRKTWNPLMTLVLNGKCLFWEASDTKIKDKQVPGGYKSSFAGLGDFYRRVPFFDCQVLSQSFRKKPGCTIQLNFSDKKYVLKCRRKVQNMAKLPSPRKNCFHVFLFNIHLFACFWRSANQCN